jgi:Fur family transcriptional regulator, ferric uptake regulator
MACEEEFIRQLRERGFRMTPQREMVLSVLHQIDGYATADEIYQRVQEISTSVDISTVYRTLELLQEFDLVVSMDPDDGQRRFVLVGVHGAHSHLQCRVCGALIGVESSEMQSLIDQLRVDYGFEVDVTHLMVPGLCQKCREASRSS